MLTITRPAARMLIATREQEGIPAEASLRVASSTSGNGDAPGITVGFVDEPYDGDQVGIVHGLSLCVAPEVADVLATAAIDIQEQDGETHLVLVPGP
jgi:Fe-S cluster assembly iron-binding protein IscA